MAVSLVPEEAGLGLPVSWCPGRPGLPWVPPWAAWWWRQGLSPSLQFLLQSLDHLPTPEFPVPSKPAVTAAAPKTKHHMHKPPRAKYYKFLQPLLVTGASSVPAMPHTTISNHRKVKFPSGICNARAGCWDWISGAWLFSFHKKHCMSQGTRRDLIHSNAAGQWISPLAAP